MHMSEEQLSALALIHMNYKYGISFDHVRQVFIKKYACKMEKAGLLFSQFVYRV